MHDLINVKELTTDVLTEKVVEMVQELQRRVNGGVVSTSTETVEETTATVAETEIIEHEGLKLKRVDREAMERDYVRLTGNTSSLYTNGKIYGPVIENCGTVCLESDDGVKPSLYREHFNRTPSTVEVFEIIDVQAEKLPFPEVELTANQKRAKLIEDAKKFVEEVIERGKNSNAQSVDKGHAYYRCHFYTVNFRVKKNKVTALVFLTNCEGERFGYKPDLINHAECAPGDVFNEHIGKAIALARALEIDVPEEFLKAVQPEFEVGQVVGPKYESSVWKPFKITSLDNKYSDDLELLDYTDDSYIPAKSAVILDDTNAKYDEVV